MEHWSYWENYADSGLVFADAGEIIGFADRGPGGKVIAASPFQGGSQDLQDGARSDAGSVRQARRSCRRGDDRPPDVPWLFVTSVA